MAITIIRNQEGNCITFRGSTNPAYFNACLSGEVAGTGDLAQYVNVRNDIASAGGNDVYEFYQIDYTEFRDKDGNPFASAAEAADYITAEGNVLSVEGANYLGTWNADTNTPALVTATHAGQPGDFYFVGVEGTTDLEGITNWKQGERVIWNGSNWEQLKVASIISGKTISTLHDTQTQIFAAGEAPVRDPNLNPGWYYTNTENNKINWYIYGDTPIVDNSLGELKGAYAVIDFRSGTSRPFFEVYTTPQGDGQDQTWFRSRVTYKDDDAIEDILDPEVLGSHTGAMAGLGKYTVFTGNLDPAIIAAIEPDAAKRISLSLDAANTLGLQGSDEEIYLLSLSTASGRPAGSEEFVVEKFGYIVGTHQSEYLLTALPTVGGSVYDETPAAIDFRREATGTTILANDGQQFSVNSIHAIANGDGTVDIVALPGQQTVYSDLIYGNITITDSPAGTTENGAVNALNALFANLPLGAGGSYVPTYPTLAGVPINNEYHNTNTPDPVTQNSSGQNHLHSQTNSATNADVVWSTETIDQAGEYYTLKIAGGGRFIIGLGREEDGDRTELEALTGTATGGSSSLGMIWGQAFYDYGSYTAPWTWYGSSTSSSYGPGWSFGGNDKMMRYNSTVQAEHGPDVNGKDGTLFKIGIDQNSYISCWYYDAGRSNDWILTSRRNIVTAPGEYFLVVKLWDQNNVLTEMPLRVATDPAAPALAYRYIESPDGSFYYPLFASADEAAYVDVQNGGTAPGSAHAHVFIDEPTASVWYMPDNGVTHAGASAPSNTAEITYTEIPTNADNLYAPALLNLPDYTFAENTVVNFQIHPQDSEQVNITPEFTLALSNLGLNYNNGFITGTTSYVIRNTPATITVSRSNNYGTTTETFGITITDNASLSDIAGWTETQGNFVQPDRIILGSSPSTGYDALLQYDTQINPGEELTYTYVSGQVPPTIGILNATGEANLAAFNPATDTLGTVQNVNNFAQEDNWDLRYVSFSGYIGAPGNSGEKHRLIGWADNTYQPGDEGTLYGPEFKLEYGVDGYFRLYVGGVLKLTSANTFSGPQTLTAAAFNDQQQSDVYIPANWTIASTVDTDSPPTGFVDPVESGAMSTSTLFGPSTDGAVFLTETLKVNHRYIVPRAWIEANVLPNIAGSGAGSTNEYFYFGVPKDTADFSTINELNNYHASFRIGGNTTQQSSRIYVNGNGGVADDLVLIASTTQAFYDYAIEWDGTDLHVIACNIGDINTQPGINNGGAFSRTVTLSDFAADHGKTNAELNLVIAIKDNASVNLTTSGLQQIRIPFGTRDVIVGEASGGGSMFALAPSATVYDSHANGHASTTFGMSFDAPTLNAGYTYRFIYHPSLEAGDNFKFTRIDDGTDYTVGVTFFDGTSNGDPNFTEGYKGVTFTIPSDAPPLNVGYNNAHQGNTNYVLKPLPLSGSTYTVEITGVTQEGPTANQDDGDGANWSDEGTAGWISIDETVGAGERITFSAAFLHDLISSSPGYGGTGTRGSEFRFGFKDTNWSNVGNVGAPNDLFEGGAYLHIVHTQETVYFHLYGDLLGVYHTTAVAEDNILGSNLRVFFEITNSGNSIRAGMSTLSTGDDLASTPFAEWSTKKVNTQDQGFGITTRDFMMLRSVVFNNTPALSLVDIDFTLIEEVAMPTVAAELTTSWTKALDFSGSAERTLQAENNSNRCPIMMSGLAATAGPGITTNVVNTSAHANSRPWATAIVFSPDLHNSNQHIWNQGEGTGSTDDNIYVRLSASGQVYFGWGRDGALNECYLGNVAAGSWYGLYVSSNGERLSGLDATANNLARCFDIRWVTLSSGQVQNNLSIASNWTSTGGRMDRAITGDMTIGGRGSNRSFHGKVAAMVVTTLRRGVAIPDSAEISMMVRDPFQWLLDYKVGNVFRLPWQGTDTGFGFSRNDGSSSYSTQVWLMGDGDLDAYPMIRNATAPNFQSYTPMNMVSMVSNDIETVNIGGLTS